MQRLVVFLLLVAVGAGCAPVLPTAPSPVAIASEVKSEVRAARWATEQDLRETQKKIEQIEKRQKEQLATDRKFNSALLQEQKRVTNALEQVISVLREDVAARGLETGLETLVPDTTATPLPRASVKPTPPCVGAP